MFKIFEKVWNGIVIFFVGLFALGIAISYPWTLWIFIPIILLIIIVAVKDRKKPTNVQQHSRYIPQPRDLTAIANEKRNYMYQMFDRYDKKRKELESLEKRKDSMDAAEYEREWNVLNTQVRERKKYYEQAVSEYHAAELEAP